MPTLTGPGSDRPDRGGAGECNQVRQSEPDVIAALTGASQHLFEQRGAFLDEDFEAASDEGEGANSPDPKARLPLGPQLRCEAIRNFFAPRLAASTFMSISSDEGTITR